MNHDPSRPRGGATFKHTDVTDAVIGAFYDVYNALGYGFLEKVYENALVLELEARGLSVAQQVPIPVYYRRKLVGEYVADIVVNGILLIELKACKALAEEHEAQLLNYLKATTFEVGLLLNFGQEPQVKRKAYENSRKGTLSWTSAT